MVEGAEVDLAVVQKLGEFDAAVGHASYVAPQIEDHRPWWLREGRFDPLDDISVEPAEGDGQRAGLSVAVAPEAHIVRRWRCCGRQGHRDSRSAGSRKDSVMGSLVGVNSARATMFSRCVSGRVLGGL